MSCEICGRNNCTRSFHSVEDQDSFDNIADGIKERMINALINRVKRIDGQYIDDDVYYIPLDDVIKTIEDY